MTGLGLEAFDDREVIAAVKAPAVPVCQVREQMGRDATELQAVQQPRDVVRTNQERRELSSVSIQLTFRRRIANLSPLKRNIASSESTMSFKDLLIVALEIAALLLKLAPDDWFRRVIDYLFAAIRR